VAKVKKGGAVSKAVGKARSGSKRAPSGARKRTPRKKSDPTKRRKSRPPIVVSRRDKKDKKPTTPLTFHVVRLDPQQKCGTGTTVEHLYRVKEAATDGAVQTHLVFFDRHGWYCEHGRNCPAVPHARKLADRERHHGPTTNGRMRA
jgi:hypothetical protein